jgi:O-antigen/teichoic acid export membrane protein
MSLIGQAIGQVYLSRAADAYRAGDLAGVTAETISYLAKTGVGPLLAAGLVAPFVFEPIFGVGWHRAGVLITWMTPWFVLQLLAVPIAMSLHVTGRQRLALVLQFFGLLVRVAAIVVASRWVSLRVAEAYALSGAAFYLAYLVVVLQVTGVDPRRFRRSFFAGWPHMLGWVVLGAVLAVAASSLLGSR